MDNAVDEALAGFADRIDVTLLADGGVRCADNGRGIPVDMHPVEKRPALEVVLTTLHAGGKFDSQSYAVSGGLHGVGVSVVNALSSRLEVEVRKDGYVWRQSYASTACRPRRCCRGESTDKTGTIITFWPDDTIFETTEWSFETLSGGCRRWRSSTAACRSPSPTSGLSTSTASRTWSRSATTAASRTSSATSTRRRTRCTPR